MRHDTLHAEVLVWLQGKVTSVAWAGCTVGGDSGVPVPWLLDSGVVEGICVDVGCNGSRILCWQGSVSAIGVEQIAVL